MSDTDVLMIVKIVLVQRIISLDGYVTFSLKNIYQVIKVTINNYIMIMLNTRLTAFYELFHYSEGLEEVLETFPDK